MNLRPLLFVICFITGVSNCFPFAIKIKRDIAYTNHANETGTRHFLDVYYPKNLEKSKDVLVFIHGGSWDSGKKETYWWLGRNFAHKNVVTVIVNYSLSPQYQYKQMATDCSAALKWVKNNSAQYGGNPDRIFVMGHSAGGHLAALINSDPHFFKEQGIENPIKGLILNDGFGLDMFEYLMEAVPSDQKNSFLTTFSNSKEIWKVGSPLTYSSNISNPYLIFTGEKTYPAIQMQSKRLFDELSLAKKQVGYEVVKRKKHIGMITQMIFGCNQMYVAILGFMRRIE